MRYNLSSIILPLLTIIGCQSFAQRIAQNFAPPKNEQRSTSKYFEHFPRHYHILGFTFGGVSPISPGQVTQTTFQYSSYSLSTGEQETKTFNGTAKNGFANQIRTIGAVYESVFRENHDIVLGIGGFHNIGGDGGLYYHLGYRYVVNLGAIAIKPGLDFYHFRGSNHVGDIDNYQKELWINGFKVYSNFTLSHEESYTDDDGNTYTETITHTYDADRVEVKYVRKASALQPVLAASSHWRRLSFGLEAGYMVQVKQKSILTFDQINDYFKERNEAGTMQMRRNGVLSGPKVSLMVGLLL
ncbi:hypothetical protein SIO70_24295 [Chitinophaga sancti]|uniref:hypothetical protein n=1 Tax=Chitinophaga sancti TaxID=1004 RepID=UPI002A75BD8C|nr:hypothetical protein [Chitinophaga sancti]WPQ61483.1 hypothetical protein SIO70_24295 [Chitinophaga sancti]